MRKFSIILNVVGILLIGGAVIAFANRGEIGAWIEERQKTDLPPAVSVHDAAKAANPDAGNVNSETRPSSTELPASFNLDVPFTVQAPYANWDLPYKETCEEAAALMVHFFFEGKRFTDADHADQEIRALVDFQEARYGFYEDTTAEETARFIRDRWGYKSVRVISNPTMEQIKQEVFAGRPVILPAAGQQLGNPYFRQPGPLYHMLVARGWTKDGKFITNDPGTRRGEQYLYDPDVLLSAVHDWNGGDVENGRKVMIVVDPK